MVEALYTKSRQESTIGLGPIERARQMSASNDAAFAAACRTLVMGAGILSASIFLGNTVDYLMRRRQDQKNKNSQ